MNVFGSWRGEAYDLEHPGEDLKALHKYDLTMILEKSGDNIKIRGRCKTCDIKSGEPIWERDLDGSGIVHNEYVKLFYNLVDNIGHSYGVILIHFFPTGDKADGYFLGRRSAEDDVVFGRIKLTR